MEDDTANYDEPAEVSVTLIMSQDTANKIVDTVFEHLLVPNVNDGDRITEPPYPATAVTMIVVDWSQRTTGKAITGVKF